jgi:transposase
MGRKSLRSEQFRQEACKLVSEHGYSLAEASKQLGVPYNTLWNWLNPRDQAPLSDQDSGQPTDDPRVLKIRIKELEQRIRRLETEKDILKKATAYFAREQT